MPDEPWLLDDDLTVVDRSTLERYATCPAQARLIEEHGLKTVGVMAEAGNEIHRILGEAITEYLDSGGNATPRDLADSVWDGMRASRPDIQPQVIDGMWPAVWQWCQMIARIHPHNILAYDGGQGDKSGQFAVDVPTLGVRVTSEIDLLYVGCSPELLHEIDYKTGRTKWTPGDVADSFQFQLHAWLVFDRFPDVRGLEVTVWCTRQAQRIYSVVFDRSHLDAIHARVLSAVSVFARHHTRPATLVPTWPTLEKCSACPVAAACPDGPHEFVDVSANPGESLAEYSRLVSKADAIEKLLAAHVAKTGNEIEGESGLKFGYGKPKRNVKPKPQLYFEGELRADVPA